jgi:hypothetical protein
MRGPRATDASRSPAPLATFPRAPLGTGLGKGSVKRGEAALLQLRPAQTALESGNRGRLGIDLLEKLFLVFVWHRCV